MVGGDLNKKSWSIKVSSHNNMRIRKISLLILVLGYIIVLYNCHNSNKDHSIIIKEASSIIGKCPDSISNFKRIGGAVISENTNRILSIDYFKDIKEESFYLIMSKSSPTNKDNFTCYFKAIYALKIDGINDDQYKESVDANYHSTFKYFPIITSSKKVGYLWKTCKVYFIDIKNERISEVDTSKINIYHGDNYE
jgi:hypothetical protein